MLNVNIAKIAGVSPATVSRVLKNSPSVSEKTVQRVRRALAQKGYSLDVQRKRAGAGAFRTRNIAMVLLSRDALHSYSTTYTHSVNGVGNALNENHLNMIYAEAFSCEQLPPCILEGEVDGLILAGTQPPKEVLEKIKDIPTVWLSSHREDSQSTTLSGNDIVSRIAVDYLVSRGHKSIAVLNALQGHPAINTRCELFSYYANNRGVESHVFNPADKQSKMMSIEEVRNLLLVLIDQMLELEERPTGLFLPLDIQVAMAYDILQRKGVKIGHDMELIGCDNDTVAILGLNPKPATIDIGAYTMGRRAVQELIWKLENPNEKDVRIFVIIEPKLIPGDPKT